MKRVKTFLILFSLTVLVGSCLKGQIYYTIGSSKDDVIKLQGTPSETKVFPDTDTEVLIYGKSRVSVSLLTKKVISYNNSDSNLRIKLIPGRNSPNQDFLVHDSDLHKIIILNGTPKSYFKLSNEITIVYGESILNFNEINQKIAGSMISDSDKIKMPDR